MSGIIGKKLGMSSLFTSDGKNIPVTIIEAGPCTITNIRTIEKDGYESVQLGYGKKKEKKVNRAQKVYYDNNNIEYPSFVKEFRNISADGVKIGDLVSVGIFKEGEEVNVIGTSKGKGFQGVMRRHNFGGVGGATHGQHNRLRAPGSIGSSSYPSRVFKGMRMAGRMGNDQVTIKNLEIVKIVPEKNIIIVKGAIPGAINSIVQIVK